MDRLEDERLAMQLRLRAIPLMFPRKNVGEILVVAHCFTIRCLMFFAKMSAARFVTSERVTAHQFAKLEEIGDAAGAFE